MKTQPLLLMPFVAVTMNAQAASFNCAKASTFVEKQICHNPYLSKLDEALATKYTCLPRISVRVRPRILNKLKNNGWVKEIAARRGIVLKTLI